MARSRSGSSTTRRRRRRVAAPDRAPNANGWYRSSVRISFAQAAGDLSGPDTCSAPDRLLRARTQPRCLAFGTCTDKAGNTSAAAACDVQVRRDRAGAVDGTLARGARCERLVQPAGHAELTGPMRPPASTRALARAIRGRTERDGPCPARAPTGRGTSSAGDGDAQLRRDARRRRPRSLSRAPNGTAGSTAPLTVSFVAGAGGRLGPGLVQRVGRLLGAGRGVACRGLGTCTDQAGNTSAPGDADDQVRLDAARRRSRRRTGRRTRTGGIGSRCGLVRAGGRRPLGAGHV